MTAQIVGIARSRMACWHERCETTHLPARTRASSGTVGEGGSSSESPRAESRMRTGATRSQCSTRVAHLAHLTCGDMALPSLPCCDSGEVMSVNFSSSMSNCWG